MDEDYYRRKEAYKAAQRRKPWETPGDQAAREGRDVRIFVAASKGVGLIILLVIFLIFLQLFAEGLKEGFSFGVWFIFGVLALGVLMSIFTLIYDYFTA